MERFARFISLRPTASCELPSPWDSSSASATATAVALDSNSRAALGARFGAAVNPGVSPSRAHGRMRQWRASLDVLNRRCGRTASRSVSHTASRVASHMASLSATQVSAGASTHTPSTSLVERAMVMAQWLRTGAEAIRTEWEAARADLADLDTRPSLPAAPSLRTFPLPHRTLARQRAAQHAAQAQPIELDPSVRVYRAQSRLVLVGSMNAVCDMLDRCIAEEHAGRGPGVFSGV